MGGVCTTRFNKALVDAVGRMPVVFFMDCNRPGAVYWAYIDQVDEIMASLNYGGSQPTQIDLTSARRKVMEADPDLKGASWSLVKIEPDEDG